MAFDQYGLIAKSYRYHEGLHKTANFAMDSKEHLRTAFLCHSHKDESLVKGLLVLFQEKGVNLYVDWLDSEMPESPNGETASRIQDKIKSAYYFFFLATANSKASRWCPWEIGYADGVGKKVCIISTSDDHNTYGNEYLQLYSHIDDGVSDNGRRHGLAVFEPNSKNGFWL